MTISQALIADYALESPHTKKLLGALPEDKFDWKPHEKSWSLAQLAGHIAEAPSWLGSMLEDEMDFASMPEDYKPFAPKTLAELLETLEANSANFAVALQDRDDAFMNATWTARKGDEVLMSMPRHWAIRSILLHHVCHHRGQLTVYMRLIGVDVPSTYGPTADDPTF